MSGAIPEVISSDRIRWEIMIALNDNGIVTLCKDNILPYCLHLNPPLASFAGLEANRAEYMPKWLLTFPYIRGIPQTLCSPSF